MIKKLRDACAGRKPPNSKTKQQRIQDGIRKINESMAAVDDMQEDIDVSNPLPETEAMLRN